VAHRHALIAGATGIVGTRVAERLQGNGWDVTGLCRRPPESKLPYRLVPVDLTDAADCRAKLAPLRTVTHLFYAARYDHPEGTSESVDVNAAMLANLIDALEPVARGLQHVHLVHGTKYYGHMLGPLKLPLTEESPRASSENFYFAHEDFVREASRGKSWAYSTSRPHTFCDPDPAEPRNAALLIAVYASLARALDLPLDFPGSERSFHARTQFTFVPMLARAIEWMAGEPRCANQSYNITNGDSPRWSELWPRFAAYFGVEAGGPTRTRLEDHVAGRDGVWQKLVRERGLAPGPLSERVLWPYADYLFAPEWDIISSNAKARRDGYGETVDSAEMFAGLFDRFRDEKIIP
jgi:nucleoside-diphosphate-sugar epimerase